MASRQSLLLAHQAEVRACRRCPRMIPPSVVGRPVLARILLIGQAPGAKEPQLGRPFAWTAGKQLFKWFSSIGVDEESFRSGAYIAAVCRCFPGKNDKGGDRVPDDTEIANCRQWLERELELVRPEVILPVGRLAISQLLEPAPLVDMVGKLHRWRQGGRTYDVLPLPHPSGLSTWHRTEPGKSLLTEALRLLAAHPAWAALQAAAIASSSGPALEPTAPRRRALTARTGR